MKLATLQETAALLTACIKSCTTQPQLATCREMIDRFIKERYHHYENAIALALVLNELDALVEDQRAVMVANLFEYA